MALVHPRPSSHEFRAAFTLALLLKFGICRFSFGPLPVSAAPPAPVLGAGEPEEYLPPRHIGTIWDRRVGEVSGIVPIKGRERCYWVHNDSGDSARIIALHDSGRVIAEVAVTGAEAHDWEDISRGPAHEGAPASLPERLYIADTGNNDRKREVLVIYRLPEPELPSLEPDQKLASAPAEKIRFRYPDTAFDCEAVAVHPGTGKIYLFTKVLFSSSVFRLDNPAVPGETQKAVKVAQMPPRFLVTAADISPDGRRLILRTYLGAEEYRLPENTPFERIFAQPRVVVPTSYTEIQGEAICFDHDGRGYVTVSEGIPGIIHRVRRRKAAPSPAPK